jgi:hypothetical protein
MRVLLICVFLLLTIAGSVPEGRSVISDSVLGEAEANTLGKGSVNIHTSSGYALSKPLELTANFTYAISSSANQFQIWIHVIQSFAYVNVTNTMILASPEKPFTYSWTVDELGNDVLMVKFKSESGVGRLRLTVLQHLIVYSIKYNIDPAKVGTYNTASELYKLYTSPAQYVESNHPEIIAASKSIVGNETNPYLAATRIFHFLVQHVKRDWSLATYNPATEGALFTLRKERGVCRHFSALFVALARAAGIPAAMIWGSWDYGLIDKHDWAHFYLPNYGWIPVETTFGDSQVNADQWFARLPDNIHIPVMSVNYGYQRAWWSGGTAESLVPKEEPYILGGFLVPEFPANGNLLLWTLSAIVCLIVLRKRQDRRNHPLPFK